MKIITKQHRSYDGEENLNPNKLANFSAVLTEEFEAELKVLAATQVTDIDFSENQKIYFDSMVSFPRTKLALVTNAQRVIKAENADFVVFDFSLLSSLSTSYVRAGKIMYDTVANDYIFCYGDSIKSTSKLLFYKNVTRPLRLLTTNSLKMIENMHKYVGKKIIDIADFNKIIKIDNGLVLDPPAIEKFLKSTDNNTVTLGLKMLCQYDIISNAFDIATLIKNNINNIRYNSFVSSALFKNVLETISISMNMFERNDSTEEYLMKLYPICTDVDKIRCVEAVEQRFLANINQFMESYFRNYNYLPIIPCITINKPNEE